MYWPLFGIIAFAFLAILFFAPILWSRRDELPPWRHHDHLIPPEPHRAVR